MTAAVFVEAVDTAVRLGWAMAAWIVCTALAATLALYAVVVCAWAAARGVGRTVRALWAHGRRWTGTGAPETPSRAPSDVETPERAAGGRTARREPSWVNTQPIHHDDIKEAA